MKKLLALLLATVMCLSLVACGGEQNSETMESQSEVANNTPETNSESTNPENTANGVDYKEILLNGNTWANGQAQWRYINTDRVTSFVEDGTTVDPSGTWMLDDNVLIITLKNGTTETYEFKELNGIYYLMSERNTMYQEAQVQYSEIPYKAIEITLDNWQEYFEFYYESEDVIDQFGESTGQTNEYYRIRLKDEYYRISFFYNSEVFMRFTQDGKENDTQYKGWDISIMDYTKYPLEMVKIQGTLYLVDGLH